MNPYDLSLFRWINQWPDSQAPFWLFLSKGTNQGTVRFILLAIVIGLLIRKNTRTGGLVAATAWIFANIWTDLFKAAIPFKRPMAELPDVLTRGVGLGGEMGTASAHSANMMCVAVCFCWYFRWWGAPWIVLAILVGISRCYVGAHYPSQVLLGWIVGALTAVIISRTVDSTLKVWRDRKQKKSPLPPSQDPPAESHPEAH